ncbi:MAG: hypothetical protein O3C40_19205 [Planctomycetota bacterium]|nr:hypothetical protein [Planctomycetota bacterium]
MRRILQIIIGIFCAAIVDGMLPSSLSAGELTEAEFRRLHEQLQPAPDEPWRTIPWKIAVLDAQRTAVKEKKPIFIWAMDGHPLGCT